jgi:uncharacterized protein YgiM (DUF1202 family)
MDKKFWFSFIIVLTLTACTQSRATVTPPPPTATVTPTLSLASPAPQIETPIAGDEATIPPVASFTPIGQLTPEKSDTYAVINVPADEVLNIRSGPGVENPVLGTLQPSETGLKRTGKTSGLGDDLWVEIQNPSGGTGWVKSDFLTEYVTPSTFCGDTRVISLLQNLETAVNATDGKLLKSLVSPAHGLDVAYIRDGMVANYSPEEADWAFQSTYEVNWGLGAGSGEPATGTFPEIVLPALQDVFKNLTTTCNEVKLGGATYVVEWPIEYANINFYSLHNPGVDPSYAGMDWRTWLAGVEYVDGKPYLFALLHYQWEP